LSQADERERGEAAEVCCAERPTRGGAEQGDVTAHVSGDNKLEVLNGLSHQIETD